MISRRTVLAALGGTAALAGCLSTTDQPAETTDSELSDDEQPPLDDNQTAVDGEQPPLDNESTTEPLDRSDPVAVVRGFYEALFTGQTTVLNEWYVHPESPTYPIEAHHLPPPQFEQVETATIVSIEPVSVQDRVVQQLFANVTHSGRIRREMGAERLQYVHTTFYVTLSEEPKSPAETDGIDIDSDTVDEETVSESTVESGEIELDDSTESGETNADNGTGSDKTTTDEPSVYVGDAVDYLVRDDGNWFVRYDR